LRAVQEAEPPFLLQRAGGRTTPGLVKEGQEHFRQAELQCESVV